MLLKNTILIPVNQCLQNYKMPNKEIKVPNIGEFKDVEVIEVLVSNGQSISNIHSDQTDQLIKCHFTGFFASEFFRE